MGGSKADAYWSAEMAGLWSNAEAEVGTNMFFGLDYGYFLTNNLLAISGLQYASKNFNYRWPKNTYTNDIVLKNTAEFLSVPIGIRNLSYSNLFLGGGLYFAFPLGKMESEMTIDTSVTGDTDIENDIGIFLDFGYDFKLSNSMGLTAAARYELGLTEVYSGDPEEELIANISPRSLYITLGWYRKI